jgi:predicted AAA+ superfamily ATPase
VLSDEVQYAPGLFRHLKVAVDVNRTRNGQFLLTGSQKFTLMKNVSELLAGRADIVVLETLSFAEMQAALPQTRIESAIVRGGTRSSTPTQTLILWLFTIPISLRISNAMCAP